MFCGIQIVILLSFVVSETSEQLSFQIRGNEVGRSKNGSGVLCSEAGNCTCMFEELGVFVKCTTAGSELQQIISALPERTAHL